MVRRHDAEHDVRIFERKAEIARRLHLRGNPEAREKDFVLPLVRDALHHLALVGPQAHALEARGENNGKRGAPATAADNGQPVHRALFPPKENTFSVAASDALQIRFMAVDDKPSRDQRGDPDRRRRMENQPDSERERSGGDDGPERDVPRVPHHRYEQQQHGQQRYRARDTKRSDKTRDSFAAA